MYGMQRHVPQIGYGRIISRNESNLQGGYALAGSNNPTNRARTSVVRWADPPYLASLREMGWVDRTGGRVVPAAPDRRLNQAGRAQRSFLDGGHSGAQLGRQRRQAIRDIADPGARVLQSLGPIFPLAARKALRGILDQMARRRHH